MAVVPFVYYAVNIWRTIHPSNSVVLRWSRMSGPWLPVTTFMLFLLVLLALRVASNGCARTSMGNRAEEPQIMKRLVLVLSLLSLAPVRAAGADDEPGEVRPTDQLPPA